MRDLGLAVALAALLVLARSAVYLIYPQSFFDSDQAIVGLMALHVVEGRAFPLFYYGQAYLLGVDAWLAAPFVAAFGHSVAALRTSIVLTNVATATVLVVGLVRACGLRPAAALAAAAFFVFAPPLTTASLVELGANIGPLLYVPMLWFLRDRPVAFGALLAFGFLNREFTIYALPALLAVQAAERTLFTRARLRRWAVALAAFVVVWAGIRALEPLADLKGPGSRGEPVAGATGSQVENIITRIRVEPRELAERASQMVTEGLPRQVGATHVDTAIAEQGHDWLIWPLGLGLLAALGRAIALHWRRAGAPEASRAAFGWYLLGVGATAAIAYVLTRPVGDVIDRYLLLTLYVPIGIVAVFLALEPRARWRAAVVTLVVGWGLLSAVDHLRLAGRYWHGEPDHMQVLADALIERDITVARAGYWRAYKVTFLTGERVKVASTDMVRIDEYQRLADEAPRVVTIHDGADPGCPGAERVGVWWLCRD